MARYIFDIETNGLLDTMDRVHSLVLKDVDTGEVFSCTDHDYTSPNDRVNTRWGLDAGIAALNEADEIIGHNIIKFDLPALDKFLPNLDPRGTITDTLVISRLIWTDLRQADFRNLARLEKLGRADDFPRRLIGSHSLEAWGARLGQPKDDYQARCKEQGIDPWAKWSPLMQEYCERDVEVTHAFLKLIESKDYSEQAIALEHKFAQAVARQERYGFPFDFEAGVKLYNELAEAREELGKQLREAFPPWEVRTPFTPKVNNKKLGYRKGVPTEKVKVIEFNPASRDHIANRLKAIHGWKPSEFTSDGKPKVDEKVLASLPYPEADLMVRYFTINKRIGQLSEGNQAWLKAVSDDGHIHGSVNTNGAVTGRCTHAHPNVAQVPSVRKDRDGNVLIGEDGGWGYECRSLFHAPDGMVLVGADASGLELRCLAHFMARYDDGAYGRELLEGDIHTANQEAAGLPTRDNAKTFIYAFLYGAGDEKIGSIVGGGRTAGRKLKESFLAKTPALAKLQEAVQARVKSAGCLTGIDGRILAIRSEHAALNTLLQSAGALLVKQATVNFNDALLAAGYEWGKDWAMVAHVHDEFQTVCRPDIAEDVAAKAVESIRLAGTQFNWRCPLDGEAKIGRTWAETH